MRISRISLYSTVSCAVVGLALLACKLAPFGRSAESELTELSVGVSEAALLAAQGQAVDPKWGKFERGLVGSRKASSQDIDRERSAAAVMKPAYSVWHLGEQARHQYFWEVTAIVFPDRTVKFSNFIAVFNAEEPARAGVILPQPEEGINLAIRKYVAELAANLTGPCDLPLANRAELEARAPGAMLNGLFPRGSKTPETARAALCQWLKTQWEVRSKAPGYTIGSVFSGGGKTLSVYYQWKMETPFQVESFNAYLF